MKRFKLLALCTMIFSMLVLIRCGDDDNKSNNPTGTNTTTGSFSAKVSGAVSVSMNTVGTTVIEHTDFIGFAGIQTVASKNYSVSITLYRLDAGSVVGTHQFTDGMTAMDEGKALGVVAVSTGTTTEQIFSSYSGTLTITETSPKYKGTFQFNARDNIGGSAEVSVTQGQFNAGKATP